MFEVNYEFMITKVNNTSMVQCLKKYSDARNWSSSIRGNAKNYATLLLGH